MRSFRSTRRARTPSFFIPVRTARLRVRMCAARWREALLAGQAPAVVLAATNEATLDIVSIEDLKRHAIDLH